MKNNNTKNRGFGLIETLISLGILAVVMGSAVYVGRIAIRNNIIANQRSQAYNLVRQNLELLRVKRDTVWIDGVVNSWNEPFKKVVLDGSTPYYLRFTNNTFWEIISGEPPQKNLDDTLFTEKITFKGIDTGLVNEFVNLAKSDSLNQDNSSIIMAEVEVSWNAYGNKYWVKGAIHMTDWKPQI